MRPRLVASILFAAAACGGGSNSFNGTIRGQSFTPRDAISFVTTVGADTIAVIVLVNQTGLCADLTQNKEPKSSQYFAISLGTLQNGSYLAPTGPGDFTVFSGSGIQPANVAVIGARTTDGQCLDVVVADATGVSGTVHLTNVSNSAISGSFDVTLQGNSGTPDRVTGTFNTSSCAGLGALISQNRTTTCI